MDYILVCISFDTFNYKYKLQETGTIQTIASQKLVDLDFIVNTQL